MKIFTIGFTQKSAETFFHLLRQPGLTRLVDVRLNNVSQLAGFAKRGDLAYFARALCGLEYHHEPQLAPTPEILDAYKKGEAWADYEKAFRSLLESRGVERTLTPDWLDGACLLCSEAGPEQCHRRLVAEYFQSRWAGVEIIHL